MGAIRYLTGSQVAMLSPIERSGLRLDTKTGEYLKYVGDVLGKAGAYEVMFSPVSYSTTTNDTSSWGESSISNYTTSYQDSYETLKKQLSDMWLYGNKKPIWDVPPIKEEKEMEIGGSLCHLCGEGLLYSDINRTFIKKHRKVESHKVYTCGTAIYETWNEHDVQPHETKKKRHIHAECILNCC